MRFADIENIWSVDMLSLSKSDQGRVYFERAKQVITEVLANPCERKRAVDGRRFRRDYLIGKIGAKPAVATQNPKIRQLLADTDLGLLREMLQYHPDCRSLKERESSEVRDLRIAIAFLLNRVDLQAAEISTLRLQLYEAGRAGNQTAEDDSYCE